jgi:hypothetical protein
MITQNKTKTLFDINSLSIPVGQTPNIHTTAVLDTGCTGNFLPPTSHCLNKQPTQNGVEAKIPNGAHIKSSHTATLDWPNVPAEAKNADIFPAMSGNLGLVSVGKLCDHGCEAVFTKNKVVVTRNNEVLMTGPRDTTTKLWMVPLQPDPVAPFQYIGSMATDSSSTLPQLIAFLHATCFSPKTSTWIKAIKNNFFATWPALTAANVSKHLPKSLATAQGHLDQTRRNTNSTRARQPPDNQPDDDDFTASPPTINGETTDHVYAAVIIYDGVTGQIYTDQTGRFPVTSSRGMKYLMILYEYDANLIWAEPIKNRTGPTLVDAYSTLHTMLVKAGRKPKLQRLDNEASEALKAKMHEEQVSFQLVPPGIHRRNPAERAIRTYKNHLIAGLSSCDPDFPMHLWCRLVKQANITINLLRRSRINPALSAYAQVHGAFDFNATPMAPPGTRVLTHDKPSNRPTWAPHGEAGWYIGPALEHYRCWTVYVTKTHAERYSDTVEFFPVKTAMPRTSSADVAVRAATELIDALKHPSAASPLAPLGTARLQALKQLSEIFQERTLDAQMRQQQPATPSCAPTASPNPQSAPRVPERPQRHPPQVPGVGSPPQQYNPSAPRVAQRAPHRYPTRHQQHRAFQAIYAPVDDPTEMPNRTTPRSSLAPPDSPLADLAFAFAVLDPATGKSLEYRSLIKNQPTRETWLRSAANEFGRLAQGVGGRIKGTNTIFFIPKGKVPPGRVVTYGRFVCTERPNKPEPNRTRLTVGGDRLTYPEPVGTKTADLTTLKILFNSVVSTPDAKFLAIDIKNFYLGTPMDRYEYMRIPINLIPDEIIEEYNLRDIVDADGYVYIEIQRGMYGLPQAGLLANRLLQKKLAKYGYYQCRHTAGLWEHVSRPTMFGLIVDDFGVKYVGKDNADHLISALTKEYDAISTDWTGKLFCGMNLKWNYDKPPRHVDLSVDEYIAKLLHKHQHPHPKKPQHAPSKFHPPVFGKNQQMTTPADTTPPLTKEGILKIQEIAGSLLFYGRATDSTLLHALSDITAAQAHGTEATMAATNHLMDYCATHPDATIRYYASDMMLHIHSDASYLTASKARSRLGGHFFLTNERRGNQPLLHNGAILTTAGIIRNVVASAAESEMGSVFINAQNAMPIRTTLTEMHHPQGPTPVQADNSTATGIANETVKQKKSRAMDMRYYWIQDRVRQKQLDVYWAPGATNLGDYPTKHHPPSHHQKMRPLCVHNAQSPKYVPQTIIGGKAQGTRRGCIDPPVPSGTQLPHIPSTSSLATASSHALLISTLGAATANRVYNGTGRPIHTHRASNSPLD